MAKPTSQHGALDRKRADPVQEQEEEKEVDGGEKDANESEKQNSEQNSVGNAALQSQMIAADSPDASDGDGGGGGLSLRRAALDNEIAYGGDGDADELPLTLEDLVRSWNPGTPKTKDRPSWLEPMPGDELPPEDAAYLDEIRTMEPVRVQAGFTLDAQLQPSAAVVASSVIAWSHEAMRWCGTSVLERAMAHVLQAGSSFLQDRDARVLLTRARTAAITNLMLQASPALRGPVASQDVGFLQFCLELAGHQRHAEMVRIDPGVEGKRMPKTPEVFDRCFEGPDREIEPRALPEPVSNRMRTVLADLFDMEDPGVYLPAMVAEVIEEEEDPLGLDALMAEMTGGKKDPDDALYYAALQAAERIAAATARTRVHTAAVAVAIAQVSRQWSSGAPTVTLRERCKTLDVTSDKSLRLLVEIARAAQKRNVPPRGLKAGLTRATRGLRKCHQTTLQVLGEIVGGVLPAAPTMLPLAEPTADELTWAWADGSPMDALPWLEALDPTPQNRAAHLLTRAAAGDDPRELGDAMASVADELDPLLGGAMRCFAAPCLLAAGKHEAAEVLGARQLAFATERRNGAVLADAVFTRMEAGGDRTLWVEAGRTATRLGAPGALTMLARYTPPRPTDRS